MLRKIVLVEDDDVVRENYAELLTDEGFNVEAYRNRDDAMACFSQTLPDIVILDISLEEEREGGFQLCMYLRQKSPVLPILFLTSHGSEVDKISGFRLGADDYLTKDISIEYLVVRIEALLRRYETIKTSNILSVSAEASDHHPQKLQLDVERLLIFWHGQAIELTLTQFWIVQELLRDGCQVKTYQELMNAANIYVEPNTITAHIRTIRSRFKVVDEGFNCIKTERGTGYRWLDA
ncbi:MAG: response regulator [Methylococcales bacterium]|nr:response regulator [Methylococcales bacterium]